MIPKILLCGSLCFAIYATGFAAQPAGPDPVRQRKVLQEGRYAELDRDMNAAQQAYDHGSINDDQLYATFLPFYYADPDLEPKFDQWVARFPRSYPARLARGMYYEAMAWVKRGDKYARDTSKEQFAGMTAYQQMALRDLSKSIEMDPKPILTYRAEIGLRKMLTNLAKGNRKLLDSANRIDPRNVGVRRTYLYSIDTRWGGSAEQMAAFVDECRTAHLPPTTLREFEALATADKAWALMRDKDYSGAEKVYAQALALTPDDGDMLTNMSDVLLHEKKYEQDLEPLSKLIKLNPSNTYALSNRGWIYARMKRQTQAINDYTKAAELGDAFSENELGKIYWYAIGVPRDKERAIKMFRSAAEQGNADAETNLAWALKGS